MSSIWRIIAIVSAFIILFPASVVIVYAFEDVFKTTMLKEK